MTQPNRPEPSCHLGFTASDLEQIFVTEERLKKFYRWMRGQTISLCRGPHDVLDESRCEESHGLIYYVWDVRTYLTGGQPLD